MQSTPLQRVNMAKNTLDASGFECWRQAAIHHFNQREGCLLVVEDQDDVWHLLKTVLSQQLPDVELQRTTNRRQTIIFLNERKNKQLPLPKLILQDLYLPERQKGLNLLQDLRVLFIEQQHIPIVVVSSSDNKTDIQQAYQSGASFYVIKPATVTKWTELCQSLRTFWWEQGVLPIY